MIRTGLFGGTFNPVHKGHIALASFICDRLELNELWLLVSPQNPFKQNMELLDDQMRLDMLRLAVKHDPRLVASDFEFFLPRPSYTYHTLLALKKAHPDRRFELIIGADNWQMFPHWYKHDEIVADTPIIIYPRPGYPLDKDQLPTEVQLVTDAPEFPYSSTAVRKAVEIGENITDLIDPAVWDYIRNNHLYGYND